MSNQVLCPHCKSSIDVTDKFCPRCGKKIEQSQETSSERSEKIKTIVCSTCGSLNSVNSTICETCGSELEVKEPAERKESNQPAKQTSPKKQKTKKTSPSTYVIAGFITLVAVFIVFEFRNSPASHKHTTDVSTQPQQPETNASLLSEITMLENTVSADPKNSDAQLQLANKLHDARFFPRAIEAYKSYLKLKPKDTDARVDLGICYFETEDSPQAIREIESALKIDPKHQMAMFNLGIIHLSSGNLPDAKKWFKQCVDIDPASTAGVRAQELLTQH